jgi:hypothetical protein
MTGGVWPDCIIRAGTGSRNEPHPNTFEHPTRPAGGITEFTANDIDLHYRLVSKSSMQNQHVGNRANPMRDAIFMLAPVALVIYFVAYPDQFSAFLNWAGQFLP